MSLCVVNSLSSKWKEDNATKYIIISDFALINGCSVFAIALLSVISNIFFRLNYLRWWEDDQIQ